MWTNYKSRSWDSGMKMRTKISSLIDILNFIFWLHLAARGILVPLPGIEPALSVIKAWVLNHSTTKKVQEILNLRKTLMCLMLVMIFSDYVRNRMEVVSCHSFLNFIQSFIHWQNIYWPPTSMCQVPSYVPGKKGWRGPCPNRGAIPLGQTTTQDENGKLRHVLHWKTESKNKGGSLLN